MNRYVPNAAPRATVNSAGPRPQYTATSIAATKYVVKGRREPRTGSISRRSAVASATVISAAPYRRIQDDALGCALFVIRWSNYRRSWKYLRDPVIAMIQRVSGYPEQVRSQVQPAPSTPLYGR